MWRSRPGFHFTENGGGFDSERRGEICWHFVGGRRTNKLHSASQRQKARKTCVPKQQMLQLLQKLEGMWPPKSGPKTCWQNSERYFGTTLEWNLIHLVQSYNLGSWRHVSLISGGNFARSDLSVQLSIYTELASLFFSLQLILSIVQGLFLIYVLWL